MEVDTHSPLFRTMRSYSGNMSKRARSPEGSSVERPAKRLSLAVMSGDAVSISSPTSAVSYMHFNGTRSPASGSRYPSEDWVRQTDGLSIESPTVPISNPFVTEEAENQEDEDMNIDPGEEISMGSQRPQLHPIQTMSYPHMTLAPQQPLQRYISTITPVSSITPDGPTVNVFPATPIPPPLYTDGDPTFSPPSHLSAPMLASPMIISSPTSSCSNVNSARKQRFTMGPRADCEKCRLGVKGHSVHY